MTLKALFPVTQQFQNKNGSNLVGGKIYIYYQGRTSLATTYHDEEGTVVNPNPVLLDNNGRAAVFADTIYSYTIVVCDYYGKELFSQDITLHDAISTAEDVMVIGSNGSVKVDTTTLPNGVQYDLSVNTDIIATKKSVDDVKTDLNTLTGKVDNHTTQIGQIQEDINVIESTVVNKKDKQAELNFNGSATKTVKKITQNANGELNVEFADIDLPQEVPNVEITSEDKSIKVSETTDVQTNTKKFDLSVQDGGTTYSAGDAIDLTNDTISVKYGKGLEITTDNKLQLKVGQGLTLGNDTLELTIKDLATSITDFRTGDVIAVDGPSGTAKMLATNLLKETAENVGNDLEASATSALLPYGKTFSLQKSNLIGLKDGYVESDGTIQSSLQHKYAEIPLGGIKTISVTLPGGDSSSFYAVVYQDESGTWNAKAPLNVGGEIVVSVPVQLGGKLYLNYFSNFGDITFSAEYYKSEEVFASKAFADNKFGSVIKDNAKEIVIVDKGFGSGLELIGNSQFTFNDGYYDNSGYHSSNKHNYVELDPSQIASITVTTSSSSTVHIPLIVKKSGNTYTGYLDANVLGAQTKDFSDVDLAGCRLFVNALTTVSSISVTSADEGTIVEKSVNKLAGAVADERIVMKSNAGLIMPEGLSLGKKLTIDPFAITPYKTGYYIASNGAETHNSNGAYFVFDAHGIKSIKITGSGSGLSSIFHVIIEYPNGERQTWMRTNETSVTITFQKGEIAKIYINRFGGISLSWEIEWYAKQEMIDFDTRTFPNVVRKPFNWSTKKVLVVGDSIAKGFVNGTTITAYTWAYWLNQKLGFASLTNGAVGGATFTDSTYKIKSQLENHHTDDVNLIFIAGGVNDWMIGASYSDVYNAVTEVIAYIKDNYPANTEIIFVTPIEPGGYHLYDKTKRTGLDSLDDIRQAITDAAIANDTDNLISVVDGKTFGFPNIACKSSFISIAFGDRLHPSELGYRNIYAPALLERIG